MRQASDLDPGSGRLAAALRFLVLCACLLPAAPAFAHEVRPAYLELREGAPGIFDVLFKTPMRGDARLALDVGFSGRTQIATPVISRMTDNAMVQTWRLSAIDSLAGQELRIDGLASTMTDALVRIEFVDGREWIERLTPGKPRATIPAGQSGWAVAATYLKLGVEHILLGVDHLLFVLALILIAPNTRELVKAITAFTVAHSITLAAATLGFVHVPPKPVEATIALSIAFVALEIVRAREGRPGIAARAPWLVAFAFGLLHGFGFAGALSEIGLPTGHIPVALLFFNVGVEVGQLLFVAVVLSLAAFVRLGRRPLPNWAGLVPPYLIGSVAMFWVIQRVSVF
jgi:hydrogenase/urease accessory protein HupE